MSYLRSLSATLLSAVTTFSLVTASGCGTSAVGVDECRDIEQARCEAGNPCGIVTDVDACKRYYRDHCLHGLATKPPADASVSACVQVILAAGRCATDTPDARLEDCSDTAPPRRGLQTACQLVEHPELAPECAFLLDTPPVEGSGGQGGESSGGSENASGASQGGAPAE